MLNRKKIEKVVRAKKLISEGSLVIWQTRLETLSGSAGPHAILDFLQTPTEPQEANNCNCTNTAAGCGQPPAEPEDTLTHLPPPPTDLPSVND